MNDRQLDAKVKRDVKNLAEDGMDRMSKFGDNVAQATSKVKEDLTNWVEDEVTSLSEGIEKIAGDAKETVVSAAAAVKKDVGHGLNVYNENAQAVADQLPGGFSKQAARYPWVTVTFALLLGFVLGRLFSPTSQRSETI